LLPGMPTAVFVIISAIALGSGLYQLWRIKQQDSQQQADELHAQQLAPEDNGYQDLRRFTPTRAYLLQFSQEHLNSEAAESLIQHIRRL
ncbi:EscV/YscV/HrcV family type III secretion system export apparatus protein, partial [Erwinia amylovora]|nr:EscV/YscV/HrcV family type III secretion system export apparatus protein [Erwinia amylovora]